jgi:hypothetical protein
MAAASLFGSSSQSDSSFQLPGQSAILSNPDAEGFPRRASAAGVMITGKKYSVVMV